MHTFAMEYYNAHIEFKDAESNLATVKREYEEAVNRLQKARKAIFDASSGNWSHRTPDDNCVVFLNDDIHIVDNV